MSAGGWIVTVEAGADADAVRRALSALGLWTVRADGLHRTQIRVEPHAAAVSPEKVLAIPGVEDLAQPGSQHPLVDAQPKVVEVGPVKIGAGERPVLLAGPCSVESEASVDALAGRLARLGVGLLRGGAFKPRSSPYAFQGHGAEALLWMKRAALRHGLGVVTEAMSPEEVPVVAEHADLIQIGSRSMQSFPLLRAAGAAGRPVLLKRGMSATVEEWLLAGEYLRLHGCPAVIFCERGIRSFDPETRNVLDLGAVALLSEVHGLPVVADPSHGAGRRDLVAPLARAAVAAGAAGLLIEVHADPGAALSDGPQALTLDAFEALVGSLDPAPATPRQAAGGAR